MRRAGFRLGAAALLVALGLLAAPLLPGRDARAEGEEERGWRVLQGDHARFYPEKEDWRASPNPCGFTFTNAKEGLEIYYYGTFYVEHRTRDK